jgi:hypothetical protein
VAGKAIGVQSNGSGSPLDDPRDGLVRKPLRVHTRERIHRPEDRVIDDGADASQALSANPTSRLAIADECFGRRDILAKSPISCFVMRLGVACAPRVSQPDRHGKRGSEPEP